MVIVDLRRWIINQLVVLQTFYAFDRMDTTIYFFYQASDGNKLPMFGLYMDALCNKYIRHIGEIVEALRGKTFIDRIDVEFEKDTTDSRIIETQNEKITFAPSFNNLVSWPYRDAVLRIAKKQERISAIEIVAHHIFRTEKEKFGIAIRDNHLCFKNGKCIEGTLLLDLQRYCEQHNITYGVEQNAPQC